MNLRDRLPGAPWLADRLLGLARQRRLPRWRRDPFPSRLGAAEPRGDGRDVVLLVDTFNRYFEPGNARSARRVLIAAGYHVLVAAAPESGRPLCCGRTFLAAGLVEQAREEAKRLRAALQPHVAAGIPVVGLEPSCLLTLRDELQALLPGPESMALAGQAMLLEEFLARESAAGRLDLPLADAGGCRLLVHGHCHQKAFGAMPALQATLALIPGLRVETIESSCCGMAGAFGYQAEHHATSLAMAELSLLPAVRAAGPGDLILANGTSCRHQIRDGSGKEALHLARLLRRHLAETA